MRLACLTVPMFPLAARLRSEPELAGTAAAVFAGNGNAARLVAATRPARKAGLTPGMTLPQARALLPKLVARGRDEASERAAEEALLDAADRISPGIEDAGEGVIYVDIDHVRGDAARRTPPCPIGDDRGDAARRTPPSPPETLESRFLECEKDAGRALIAAAKREGLPARCGIASSKLAAHVAASLAGSPVVVPEGGEAAFLAPLPLSRLSPEVDLAGTLLRWGLRTVGDFAKLPASEIAGRLGETGRALHDVARGLDPRPFVPRRPPPGFTEGMSLEWPVVTLPPFLGMAEAALERLVRRLSDHASGCVKLDLTLRLDPDGHDARSLALPAPTRDVKTLLSLIRLSLESKPPGAPVCGFSFTAHPDAPRLGQLTLFGPAEISPDRLATAMARLFALLGEGRAGSPRTVDGHRPERFALVPWAPPPPPLERRPPREGRGLLAVRVLRPALPLEVLVGEGGHGADGGPPPRPLSLRTLADRAQEAAKGMPDLQGSIRVASGPWHLEEGWWTGERAARDYWDVELSTGSLCRIYRDTASGDWFADGVYD
ncbi:MAG: DNA polymerase Y family protein [Acidithiobacillales bacterium]